MSRIGKQPIAIPQGVDVKIDKSKIEVKGPKGTLSLDVHPRVAVKQENSELNVNVEDKELKQDRALWGLHRALIANMVKGVTDGFVKRLEISGVGFRANTSGNKVDLSLGFSHPVELEIPDGLEVSVEKNSIIISGIDKQVVGEFAALIRSQRVPEPYKGKGIRYSTEVVRRKAGKAAKAVGGD